jgi:elongation factor P
MAASVKESVMPKANEIKRAQVIEWQGRVLLVQHVDVQSPSSRSGTTLYKMRMKDVRTAQKIENSFTGDEIINLADFQRCEVQYLYREGNQLTFMNAEDYSQYTVDDDSLGEEAVWLFDGIEGVQGMLVDGKLASIEVPTTLTLEIVETSPSIKGGSASARTKPATLSNGVVIQVPEYIAGNELVKVNTETRKFMSRA